MVNWNLGTPEPYLFSFEAQVRQYAACGMPGISYFRGDIDEAGIYVNCLLWRDEHGTVTGILNHYPVDTKWEKRGEVNVFIEPGHTRQGIGRALWTEAAQRWGQIRLGGQMDTPDGIAFGEHLGLFDGRNRTSAFKRRRTGSPVP